MFRRKFRRGFRRRRRLPETYTVRDCRECFNLYQTMTCGSPLIDAVQIMGFTQTRGQGDATEIGSGSDKYVTVDAIKFQSEYLHDPASTLAGSQVNENPRAYDLEFILTIWEAIMVLPFGQATQSLAYLPNLTGGAFGQDRDLADRVLWKRLSYVPIWGLNVPAGNTFPQLEFTARDTAAGPQVVKSRARLDDKHGLYYVRNFVHDVFFTNDPFPADLCGASQPVFGVIPLLNDSWFKIFYHTRK